MEIRLPDHSRVFGRAEDLEQRGIIIVGGRSQLSEEVALKPQPLPPREVDLRAGWQGLETQSVDAASRFSTRVSAAVDAGGSEQDTAVTGQGDTRWGHQVLQLDDTVAVIAATDLNRENPSGAGTSRAHGTRVIVRSDVG